MRASPTVTGIAAAVVSVLPAAGSHATKVVINKPAVEPRAGEAVVHSQVDTARLIALGARILADYPTFVLAEVADEVAPKFEEQARAEGFATFVRETFDQIRVNGYVVKAKGGEPELPADLTISDYKGPVGLRPSDLVSETFTIEVVPGVSANAVPGLDGNAPNQDFALYVYNATNP